MSTSYYSKISKRQIGIVKASLSKGFTLVEVLVSSVIVAIAMAGAIVAFNLITQSVRGTGLRADQSRRIDSQIAEISRLAEIYTACGTPPAGSVPTAPVTPAGACIGNTTNVIVGDSYYFFPDPANLANIDAFFAACRSTTPGAHITANFMTAINALPLLGGDITRQASTRLAPADASNHIVEVTWTDSADPDRVLRAFRISPLVSSWCP